MSGEEIMKNPKYTIFKGKNDQFYFRLIAGNGEKVMRSEGYIAKSGCENGINSVKTNSVLDKRYKKKTSSNGQFYFSLVAGNGEVIGSSEMYTTEQARDDGIEVIKRIAPSSPIEDTTL